MVAGRRDGSGERAGGLRRQLKLWPCDSGSFATGTTTPCSDADVLVEATSADLGLRERRGVAGAVAREGLRLA